MVYYTLIKIKATSYIVIFIADAEKAMRKIEEMAREPLEGNSK